MIQVMKHELYCVVLHLFNKTVLNLLKSNFASQHDILVPMPFAHYPALYDEIEQTFTK